MKKKPVEIKEMGVNVEEAGEEKHENMPSQNLWVRKKDERPDFQNLSLSYLSLMENYVSALTKRACMDKSVYEKLISDLLCLKKRRVSCTEKKSIFLFRFK